MLGEVAREQDRGRERILRHHDVHRGRQSASGSLVARPDVDVRVAQLREHRISAAARER
jgi:hypothetical protein